MPTTRPRYTVTDTGEMQDMLDAASRRWPDVEDRRQLLLRLAAAGHAAILEEVSFEAFEARKRRQRAALARAPALVDTDLLDADIAWR